MRHQRWSTSIVLALTVAAIAVPATAWYAMGSAEAERQGEQLEAELLATNTVAAERVARQLGERLETLREAESRRPFYHYQNLYHDPRGAHQGPSVVVSPLAGGPADPLVRCWFQIDPTGQVSLPTLNDELPELNAEVDIAQERTLLAELQSAKGLLGATPLPQAREAAEERLEGEDWERINRASWLFASLRRGEPLEPVADAAPPGDAVVVCVGSLSWRTVTIGDRPALVALREVETPEGVVVQGLQVDLEAAAGFSGTGVLDTQISPGLTDSAGWAGIPLLGATWRVHVVTPAAAHSAAAGAVAYHDAFLQAFLLGLGLAGAAGLGAVGLAWQASRVARERSDFAAAAAHELRTPLTNLRLRSHLLLGSVEKDGRAGGHARLISGEAERMGRIVTNLMAMTLGERGEPSVRLTEGDLAAAVKETVDRLEPGLQASGASVELDVAIGLPDVLFDKESLDHVLSNLLDNAEKYTRDASDRLIKVHVARGTAGKSVVLSVNDAGEGVPRRLRSRIFRPFSRAAPPEAPSGLGLGLALARNLARAHSGDLSCHESPRGGASFRLSLPGNEGS